MDSKEVQNQALLDLKERNLEKYQMIVDFQNGKSRHQISKDFNKDRKQVQRVINKFQTYGSVEIDLRSTNSGRKKKFNKETEDQAREVIRTLEDRRSKTIQAELEKNLNISISLTSTKRLLSNIGDYKRIENRLILTNRHQKLRKQYCNNCVKRGSFRNIIFSDESRFYLNRNTKKVFVINGDEIPFKNKFNPDVSIMVWGSVCYRGKVHLEFVEKRLNATLYKGILERFLGSADDLYPNQNWYFVQDNAPVHKAKTITKYLEDEKVIVMKHPPNSPDLNIIEQIWAIMKSNIENLKPTNKEELKAAITSTWNSLQHQQIKNCIVGLPFTMQQVLKYNGQYIPKINNENNIQN